MKIVLQRITLTNFKGVRSFSVTPNEKITNIYGDNATGKTSLFDAFLWCIFGKDSTDRKDFEIKTLDENNQPFHKLDHEVEVVLTIDGVKTTLRRLFKEKWTKPRGSETAVFAGHETQYYWNEVPMKENEYSAKIGEFIKEATFKIITNTTYFNSLKWQERRAVLLSIAGEIKDSDVLNSLSNVNITALQQALSENKTVDEFKRQIAAQKKKLKDELDQLPGRIAEAERAVPELVDYSAIEKLIEGVKADIERNDEMINNKSTAQKAHNDNVNLLLNRKQELNTLCMQIEFAEKNNVQQSKLQRESNIATKKSELKVLQDATNAARNEYTQITARKTTLEVEQTKLRAEWAEVDAKTIEFKDTEFCCPTCKREFDADTIGSKKDELIGNFNKSKSDKLNSISARGKELGEEIALIQTKQNNLTAEGSNRNNQITQLEETISQLEIENNRLSLDEAAQVTTAIANNTTYQQHKLEMVTLQEQIDTPFTGGDQSALKLIKKQKEDELQNLNKQVAGKEMRETQVARVNELKAKEEKLNQDLSELQGIEYSIEQFNKAKMDTLEQRINGRFQIVKFKLFEEQINGGQVECCDTLINGVPYADANTASKIQAGLDIINTLSAHYGIEAPVWVDNRESVVKLPETNCQLINLNVLEGSTLSKDIPVFTMEYLKRIGKTQDEMQAAFINKEKES